METCVAAHRDCRRSPSPSDWYPLFPNPVVAESLLDRLINTSHQVITNGPSYRPNKRPKNPIDKPRSDQPAVPAPGRWASWDCGSHMTRPCSAASSSIALSAASLLAEELRFMTTWSIPIDSGIDIHGLVSAYGGWSGKLERRHS